MPDPCDLAALAEDLEKAHQQADLVAASFHWGIHMKPFELTDHERRTARFCIDHGADLVVGHHHHALRGMEWYKGRPILYGLGHFVFDMPIGSDAADHARRTQEIYPSAAWERHPYAVAPRDGWPYLPMHEDTRMTVLAWARADSNGIGDIGFLPCRLDPDGSVQPLRLGSSQAEAVASYLERCNTTQGLNGRITAEGAPRMAGFDTLRVVPMAPERSP